MTAHGSVSADDVVAFLHRFEALAEREDFDLVAELIDEHAVFRDNDGDHVGRSAIRQAAASNQRHTHHNSSAHTPITAAAPATRSARPGPPAGAAMRRSASARLA
jgi:hypothetical protein